MFEGYPTFKGQVLNGQQLYDLIEGLEANDLLFYTHVLTGTHFEHLMHFLIGQLISPREFFFLLS